MRIVRCSVFHAANAQGSSGLRGQWGPHPGRQSGLGPTIRAVLDRDRWCSFLAAQSSPTWATSTQRMLDVTGWEVTNSLPSSAPKERLIVGFNGNCLGVG
jgi:hypothetical protein